MAPSNPVRNPATWDEYEGRASSSDSLSSSVAVEDQSLHDGQQGAPASLQHRNRRRSSVTNRLAAIADVGGVNSFRSFARSWQRAAGFAEVIPRRPSFVYSADNHPVTESSARTDEINYSRSYVGHQKPQTGLLRQHLEASPLDEQASGPSHSFSSVQGRASSAARDVTDRESKAHDPETADAPLLAASPSVRSSIFAVPPHLAAPPIIGSYESHRDSYGTIGAGSLRTRLSIGQLSENAVRPGDVDNDDDDDAAHGEHEPILVKEVKQGEQVVLTVDGQSTLPQSIFNSINAIIGVGLLSLPLALKMSGWIFGLIILTLTAGVTAHTSNLLAYISFGARARAVVSALFFLELIAACVALVILFADSLDLLLPGLATVNAWKCVCAMLILVLNALPLRWLSYTSVIGIFSTFCIVCIVLIDGIIKQEAPGSLREPATTYLLPSNWLALPLAYGLLASPWGAHSVFPSIYRDMRHPYKWSSAVKVTFSFSYAVDTCLAVVGILMFGDSISDAITSNILKTKGYPQALTITMCIFIAIIPLTKIPLNARPLITTADVVCGVHHVAHSQHSHDTSSTHLSSRREQVTRNVIRGLVRLSVVLILLLISILFPAFDSVCAFLGAALCSLISVILPISFYLKLFWADIGSREKVVSMIILVVFSILGIVGTVWTFLPKDLIGI